MLAFPDLGPACERFEPYTQPDTCNPDAQLGVKAFRDWVIGNLGGTDLGIVRACDIGSTSLHHEGRAWDWGVNVSKPDDVVRVQQLFDWLLATDKYGNEAAMFRRAGLTSMIWNRQSWSTVYKQWKPYTRPNPHTDHVHFSFGWPGARGQTSFYSWASGGLLPGPPIPVAPAYNKLGYVLITGAAIYLTYPYLRKLLTR